MSQISSTDVIEALSVEVEPGIRFCYDNTYIVDPLLIERDPFVLAKLQRPVYVTNMTPSVRAYNQMSLSDGAINVKEDFNDEVVDSDKWAVPAHYQTMTVAEMTDRLLDRQEALKLDDDLYDARLNRIQHELTVYRSIGKLEVLRLMFYIVDTMVANNQIWGVGRGSSVSSYVLFLIGVHDIDSVKYELDFTDFVKPQEIP